LKNISAINENDERSVIAVSRQDDVFKAVKLRKAGQGFEILWAKSTEAQQQSWESFLDQVTRTEQISTDVEKKIVIGFNSAKSAFYRISVPTAKKDEINAMVRLQAETLLPMPIEQVQLAWRTGAETNGRIAVTIAAARTDVLQSFIANVRKCKPSRIFLDSEAIVHTWKTFFPSAGQVCVILNIGVNSTQLCLVDGGLLASAVTLDIGTDGLSAGDNLVDETAERFVQDLRSAFAHFGYSDSEQLDVFVSASSRKTIEAVSDYLTKSGITVQTAEPAMERLTFARPMPIESLYEYFVPVGLAIMALDSPTDELDIFGRLYKPSERDEHVSRLPSLKSAVIITMITLAVFLVLSYKADVVALDRIEKYLAHSDPNSNLALLEQRQRIIKTIALNRPDILDLLTKINKDGPEGMMLDSFTFKKAQRVSISGHVKDREQLHKFIGLLQSRSGIKAVKIQKCSLNEKSKQQQFIITFDYKNFTRKKRPL